MSKKSVLSGLAFFAAGLFLFFGLLHLLFPPAKVRLKPADFKRTKVEQFSYTAIGDSLTEGIGDSTGQGGFVPLLTQSLETQYDYKVKADNFGVSGNTSKQILARMQKDRSISDSLAHADVMTLTVGGNDVMTAVKKHIADLDVTAFEKPAQTYSSNLVKIIEQARKDNADLPIYVLGIYNPFYLNFPELTAMQTVVNTWNQRTEAILAQFEGVYFVPVNDLLYKGIDGQEGLVQEGKDQTKVVNDALFEGDHFHPNNVGYQIIQAAIMEKMNETNTAWQKN